MSRRPVPSSEFVPVPKNPKQGIDLRTGEFAETHCMCLEWERDGLVYDVCCTCWYRDRKPFGVKAPRGRQPRKAATAASRGPEQAETYTA